MEFGVPREVRDLECRVGLTPAGALALVQAGHTVYVERGAGGGAGFSDEEYRQNGAQLVFSPAEAYGRADVVLKVARPVAAEHQLFRPGQAIFSLLYLSVSSPDLLEALQRRQITAVAYEMITEDDGHMPVLLPLSEIAGRLAPLIAGQLLMQIHGGRGTLLSGIPGVPPAAVVIVGAGTLGMNAARAFLGAGAQVTVLDRDPRRLRYADEAFGGRVTTMLSGRFNLQRATQFADVLVMCVHTPPQRAPMLITREMVRGMRQGAVIIDFAIDQGGSVETSRPTTLRDQIYKEEGVLHHCVPNVTALVGRTASYAITNAALPYLLAVAEHGLPGAFVHSPALARGVNLFQGHVVQAAIAAALGVPVEPFNLPPQPEESL